VQAATQYAAVGQGGIDRLHPERHRGNLTLRTDPVPDSALPLYGGDAGAQGRMAIRLGTDPCERVAYSFFQGHRSFIVLFLF